MRCVFDIETNGLLGEWEDGVATKVYCAVFVDIDTGIEYVATTLPGFKKILDECTVLICHNIIDYDLPVLKKLGWIDSYTVEPDTINGHAVKIVDTLILSRLFFPERRGHGLAQWGEKLGIQKPVIENWDNLKIEEYINRCSEDVKINKKVYDYLVEYAGNWKWKEAIKLEKAFQDCVSKSEQYGMYFNIEKAEVILDELNRNMAEIEEEVNSKLPNRRLADSYIKHPPKVRFKKDGSVSAHSIRYFGSYLSDGIVSHPNGNDYSLGDLDIPPIETHTTMTIDNQQDLKAYLLSEGWRPEYYNFNKETGEKTSPRFNDPQTKEPCPNLNKLGDTIPWVLRLTEWLMLRHRRNLLKGNGNAGLLNHPRLAYDKRLPAGMVTIGAGTHRVTHRVVANLPRVSTPYGEDIRSLFTCPEGRNIVGFDASALEDRLKGHYTHRFDDGEYANKINDPEYDAHTESSQLWGISRSEAKTGNYAIQFGAQIPRFSKALGVDKVTGANFYNLWWDNNRGLKDFKEAACRYWKNKGSTYVLGLDGRKIPCTEEHKVVNRIIQSAGAIVMKMATVIYDRLVDKHGIDAILIEFYHDELVVECDPKDSEKALQLGIQAIRMAGKRYKLNVDLDADGKIGNSWAEVH